MSIADVPTAVETPGKRTTGRRKRTAKQILGDVVFVLAVAVPVLVIVVRIGALDLLKPDGATGDQLGDFTKKVNAVEKPALVAFGSLSGLGLVAGAGMTVVGMPQGIRMMVMSALTGAAYPLGKGIIE